MKPNILFSILLTLLMYLAAKPGVEAVVPPPDGGYPNFTTAEGQNALKDLTTGAGNTALGAYSMFSTTTASFNTAVGAGALDLNTGDQNTAVGVAALLLNTGTQNTAVGVDALGLNSTGSNNAALGAFALYNNTTGVSNTAIGDQALFSNSTANGNTAVGDFALFSNTTGADNTAIGDVALIDNTTGSSNIGIGVGALANNTTGGVNTAVGFQALFSNTTATDNTATGAAALTDTTTGGDNTANGFHALTSNTTGNANVATGSDALSSNIIGLGNTAIGTGALSSSTGDGNTAVGFNAGGAIMTASGVICIGEGVTGFDVSNTTWMGNIYGVHTLNGTTAPVIVSADGQLGTAPSSERFKKDIVTMEKASEAILSLRPVTFHYKTDTKGTPQFGLVAEEVAKVNPALVLPDKEGKPFTVRYDAVNAMLLNEFLKEHRMMQELKTTVAKQAEQIDALTAGLQKVSAQLAAASPSLADLN
jgi:hypothetical protein